jgi:hypothetical protein
LSRVVTTREGTNKYLSVAAATGFLTAAARIRVSTVVRWMAYVAIPVVPTMVELAGWNIWQRLPYLGSFHVIYWWAALVAAVILYESFTRGRQAVRWQEVWVTRGRRIAGTTDDIGQLLIYRREDGRAPSVDAIIADILRQIVDVVGDIIGPSPNVEIMSCLLLPRYEGTAKARTVAELEASIYNEAAGRHKSRLKPGNPGPAWEAFESGTFSVVADTSAPRYAEQFAGRRYKSVVAFCVNIGQRRGKRLAVVTIDATETNFFTEDIIRGRGIEAAIFPYLKLIGMALLAKERGRLQ